MKNAFRIILNILVILALVLVLFMAWPFSGFDLSMEPYMEGNPWFYMGVVAAVIVALYVLTGVIRNFRARPRDLVEARDGGSVQISSNAIAATAVKTAKQHDFIKNAEVDVKQAGKDCAIDLKMEVEVAEDALHNRSIKSIAEEVKTDVSRSVENFSGYPINNFDIKVDVEESKAESSNRTPASGTEDQESFLEKSKEKVEEVAHEVKEKVEEFVAPVQSKEVNSVESESRGVDAAMSTAAVSTSLDPTPSPTTASSKPVTSAQAEQEIERAEREKDSYIDDNRDFVIKR
ncbi:MAG: alkaline shock response membrane anchor protein AmaP [Eubacteriales bacterium]|nr:alkaline shock response membrane anchor protein AmaP [Eubacteriales bacterium]